MKIAEAAHEFLTSKRIAVTGVSRTPENHGSNVVYRRLRERGYDVYAVNPRADTVEGDRCFPALSDIPDGVDAVVIGTRPEHVEDTMKECIQTCGTPSAMHSFLVSSACSGRVPITTASTPSGMSDRAGKQRSPSTVSARGLTAYTS